MISSLNWRPKIIIEIRYNDTQLRQCRRKICLSHRNGLTFSFIDDECDLRKKNCKTMSTISFAVHILLARQFQRRIVLHNYFVFFFHRRRFLCTNATLPWLDGGTTSMSGKKRAKRVEKVKYSLISHNNDRRRSK